MGSVPTEAEGIFPGVLDQIVLDAYRENDKAFDALLNDRAKYMAFLKALADLSYDEFKRKVSRQLGSYDAMASNDEYEYAEAASKGDSKENEGDGYDAEK